MRAEGKRGEGGPCPWRALTEGTERSFPVTSGHSNTQLTSAFSETPVRLPRYHDFPNIDGGIVVHSLSQHPTMAIRLASLDVFAPPVRLSNSMSLSRSSLCSRSCSF